MEIFSNFRYKRADNGATDNGYIKVSPNEMALKQALATQGPISVLVDATPLMHYKNGIISHGCGNPVDHAVLLTGYGKDRGQKYWELKNSWGTDWGENGYFRLARDSGNMCQVASYAVFPRM